MASMPMIEELADLLGREDPVVAKLVENATFYPDRRKEIYDLLLMRAKGRDVHFGKRVAFGFASNLPEEGRKIGDVLVGDTVQGECRLPVSALPGNMGVFGGSGTGKSSLVSLMGEWWMGSGLSVVILDVADEYSWLIDRFGADKLLVIRARTFPLGVFVNPVGSCLSPLAWLSLVVGVLRECMYLRDGSCNLLLKIVGAMYRDRGVLDGSGDYPLLTEVFRKLVTAKYSVQSRHAGYLETLVNRFHGLLQSFPAMNAKQSLIPEQVMQRSLIIRMADLSPSEIDVFTGLLLAWMMAYRESKL